MNCQYCDEPLDNGEVLSGDMHASCRHNLNVEMDAASGEEPNYPDDIPDDAYLSMLLRDRGRSAQQDEFARWMLHGAID